MDPASAAALAALAAQGGPWAVVVVVLGIVLRAWRSGEFISKPVHDTIVAAVKQRYDDLLDRFKSAQEANIQWRTAAEAATHAAEQAQDRQKDLLTQLGALRTDLGTVQRDLADLREDFHGARVWGELGPGPGPQPGGSSTRPRPPVRDGG